MFLFDVVYAITLDANKQDANKQGYGSNLAIWVSAKIVMMTSSNGTIFRVTGPWCREFTGSGEFPAQKPVTRSFDVFFDL